MINKRSVFCSVSVSTLSALCFLFDANAATFQRLGTLPGGAHSFAYAVSADGTVVVGSAQFETNSDAPFRWTEATGMTVITPFVTNNYNAATGVSANGSIVVGQNAIGACIWTPTDGFQQLPVDTNSEAIAYAVSADGKVIGGTWLPGRNGWLVAAYWTNGTGPHTVDGGQSGMDSVMAVSDDGLNLAGTLGGFAFWRAADGTLVSITNGTLNPIFTHGYGMSRNGRFVVGQVLGEDQSGNYDIGMFRWSQSAGLEFLGIASGDSDARAFSTANDGNTIVGANGDDSYSYTSTALIWRPEWGVRHLQDVLTNNYGLDLSGWHLTGAHGISVNGTIIVGSGVNPQGKLEAWIATIDPPLPHLVMQCDGVNCILSWPTNAMGFVLRQCSDTILTNWTVLSNAPSLIGDQFVVTNAVSSATAYFQLKKM